MPAVLKTTQIQEPSSSSVNIQLDSSGNVALVPTAGNVGIGTSSPGAKLDVNGGRSFFAANSEPYSIYLRYNGSTAGFYIGSPAADVMSFSSSGGTERLRITANGAISFGSSGTATGTSGQVLTSAGSGASPTWSTISATGALIRAPQILTSGTSYTTPSNCTAIYVELWGAGGSGGSWNAAGGGGSGAYLAKYISVTGSTAYTIAIGSGGTAVGTNNNGNSGGNTTITVGATTYTAGGGGGGSGGNSNPSTGTGGSGGTATNGDINLSGMSGNTTVYNGTSYVSFADYALGSQYGSGTAHGGAGGCTVGPLFTKSGGGGGTGNGSAGTYYGAGGGGSAGSTSGAGYQGLIRIWEYT